MKWMVSVVAMMLLLLQPIWCKAKEACPLNYPGPCASWYGPGFEGNQTANGEVFDKEKNTAAARPNFLPLGAVIAVTNLMNGKSVIVRINDRGPFRQEFKIDTKSAVIDLAEGPAIKIGLKIFI